MLKKLEPTKCISEELGSNSEEENTEDNDTRCETSSNYKININIADFYSRMHVEKLLNWISDIDNFSQYIKIRLDKRVKLVAFKLKDATSSL